MVLQQVYSSSGCKPYSYPEFHWDKNIIKMTRDEFQDKLRKGNPSIEMIGGKDDSVVITVWMLKPGQEKIVATRVNEELSKASV